MLKENGCDFVVSFGGGSPHDCAKAISMLASNGGSIKDYEGVDKSTKPMLPLAPLTHHINRSLGLYTYIYI